MKLPIALAAVLFAQAGIAQPPGAPPPPPPVSRNPASAPAGNYMLDVKHASVIARIAHGGGTSFSTFRFGQSSGMLTWNGAKPEASQVSITIDMTSIESPVSGFAAELVGDRFLKTGAYHDAKFVSTGIRRTGPTAGKIMGNLTFMGQTRPITIDATMVGAGVNRGGAPVVGFSGTTRFKRSDFGFGAMVGPIGDEIEVVIDVEFDKAA